MTQGQKGTPNLASITPKLLILPSLHLPCRTPSFPQPRPSITQWPCTEATTLAPLGKTHPRATFSRRARVTRKTNRTLIQGRAKVRLTAP